MSHGFTHFPSVGKWIPEIAKANSFIFIFNTSPKAGEPDLKWTKTGTTKLEEKCVWGGCANLFPSLILMFQPNLAEKIDQTTAFSRPYFSNLVMITDWLICGSICPKHQYILRYILLR